VPYSETAWIEKVLTRQPDGSCGVATVFNNLNSGGLNILEWRIIHTDPDVFVLLVRVGKRPSARNRDKNQKAVTA
jgi:hypothetical protein